MIIFVGSRERGFFVEEEVKKQGMNLAYINANTDIKKQTNQILNESASDSCKFLVIDIEQYANDAKEIADEITRIVKVNNAKPIIYAPGYSGSSVVVTTLLSYSITNFIFAVSLTRIKDQLEKCMNGYFDANGIEELKDVPLQTEDEEIEELRRTGVITTISVAGTMARIGTTTQALQIVKYLMFNGYKVAYIEMNRTGYTKVLAEYFESEVDEELSKVTIENTDMFYDPGKISEILKLRYDYYVYDFGVFEDTDYNKNWYLEKDIKVMVGGTKANEIIKTTEILGNTFYSDVYYLMSFIDEAEKNDVLELMKEKAERTFFPVYTPNPFSYGNSDIYQKFLNVENKNPENVTKKGIFTRWRKK